MLACDEVIDLVAKLLATHLNTRQSLPIIDKNNGKVDHVMCRSPVVVVIKDVEDEDGYTVPFINGHELGAACDRVNAEGGACSGNHLVVPERIEG